MPPLHPCAHREQGQNLIGSAVSSFFFDLCVHVRVYTHLSPLFGFNTLCIEHAHCEKVPGRDIKRGNLVKERENKNQGGRERKKRVRIRKMEANSKWEINVRVLAPVQ